MNAIMQLFLQTFIHPRETAIGMAAERFDRATLWTCAFFVIIFSGIVQYALLQLSPQNEIMLALFTTPFVTTAIVGAGIVVMIYAVYFAGKILGGTGQFDQSLILVSWIQFMQAAISAFQIVLIAISPQLLGMAAFIGLVAAIGILHATLHFIDVLHGYNSLWTAFGTLVISLVGLGVVLAMVLALFGGPALQTGTI